MNVLSRFGFTKDAFTKEAGRLALCLALVLSAPAAFGAAPGPRDAEPDDDVLPGVVVVQVKEGVDPSAAASKMGVFDLGKRGRQIQVRSVEKMFPPMDGQAAKHRGSPAAAALDRVYYVHYDGPLRPQHVAAALARDPDVAFAEPYFVYRLDRAAASPVASTPDDALFADMTHLQQLRMTDAWDVVKGEDGNVVIAIVDGGAEWRHPDLQDNVWTNPGEIDGNGLDDDGNGFVDDINGWNFTTTAPDPTAPSNLPQSKLHGTAVAGAAAAVTNNALGVAGTSWNASFMPIGAACSGEDNLICASVQGIRYAAENGADIINASFGGSSFSQVLKLAVDFAYEQGALVVASAGNSGGNSDLTPQYPANYDRVLSVGATRKDTDAKVGFSNYGRTVDVFAPGLNVDTTFPDGAYNTISGTSFSAPLVAGIAALVKTQHPEYSVDQLREQIRVTSDNIDGDNPTFAGRMGRGRVNALRAVTESSPAIRMTAMSFTDSGGDNGIESGETIQVTATFINYLADAAGVTITLTTEDPFITLTNATASPGALASGDSVTVTFTFDVANDTPDGRALLFFTEVSAGAYSDADIIRLSANVKGVASHSSGREGATPALRVSITDEGNIGYLGFQGETFGDGFVVQGDRDLLFEGGLLIATGPGRVSDCVRGLGTPSQEADFVLQTGTTLEIISPGELTNEQGRVSLTDEAAASPLGVQVLQESFVDSDPDHDNFIILRYTIDNTSADVLSDLFVGLFFDWDVDRFSTVGDAALFDEDRQFGYIQDGTASPSASVGALLLTDDAPLAYRAIDNPTELYPDQSDGGFTEVEKWAFLSDGVQRKTLLDTDASQLVGAGPYSIDPGASIMVAFAVVSGRNEGDLLENVDNAKALWDNTINAMNTGVEAPTPTPGGFALLPVYPNPFAPPATLAFELGEPSSVTVTVYDALGRKVRTLLAGPRSPGAHTVVWDGDDRAGQRVASGVYFVRFTAAGATTTFSQSRQMVVVR